MKKIDFSTQKNNSTHNGKQSQRKISMYFMKNSKNEKFIKSNNSINNIDETTITNDEIQKKRKISEILDSSQTKIAKFNDDASNVHNIENIQKQNHLLTKPNVIHNVFNTDNINTNIIKTKYKDASIVEFKENIENIEINKYTNTICNLNEEKKTNNDILCNTTSDVSFSSKEFYGRNIIAMEEHKEIHSEIQSFFTEDFNDCFEEEWSIDNQINFNSLQRCKIIDVKREYNNVLLTVKQDNDYAICNTTITCLGFWKDVKVQKNDIVIIQARKENKQWIIDNNSGFLIIHPDILISGTTVVGALFCKRKAILAEKFKKLENLPYFKTDQSSIIIGSLVHQLLQKAIQKNIYELSDITKLMDNLLQSKDTSNLLYASQISFSACREQILTFVPKIYEFLQHYVKDKKQQKINNMQDNFKGRITNICDIEENIWLPMLGLKGKIDVTVEVKINSKRKIMPLEIKTGKPSFSLEHKGQIILYIIMMTLTRQDTDTGLLLYLRENIMQEINSKHPEKRDLILLRNSLANYFTPKLIEKSSLTLGSDWQTLDLPEPINHHSACSKCMYNVLCCMYLNKDTNIQLSNSHPLIKLSKQILSKFKPSHIDYISQWVSLLQIEENAQSNENIIRYMWTLSPEKREAKKICICNLKIIGKVIEYNSKYKHTFIRANVKEQFSNTNIPYMIFSENEYVLISTNTRINISTGFIAQRKEDSITILLDRDITKYNINEFFHIDKYSSSSLFSFNFANVGGLMGDNEICEKLRNIVIDRKPATFEKELSDFIIHKSTKELQNLNKNQQRAVLKAISANDYFLIKGMPGTGKTQTLIALIEILHKIGHSILITAHTNSAVDNILLKLLDKNIDFLRLGSSVHPSLKYKSEEYVTSNCHSPESLEAIYSNKNIIGVTCYGAHHALLGRRIFDICLVDESAQALQPSILRPLYSAKKFVLVGDPNQLPPIIKSKLARKLGADESLFARLDSENNTVNLTKQYRMNKNIMFLANKLTYNDMLEAGNTSIENAIFFSPHKNMNILMKEQKWIQKVLSSDINDSVIIINTGCTNKLKISCDINTKYLESDQVNSNIWEAIIVLKLVQTLLKMQIELNEIGIIAPYRAHVNLLKKIIIKDIEINTVDQYQGRDKQIIIYSCAKSLLNNRDIEEDIEVLGDYRRLTVAITRAKCKLIVIADKTTLSQFSAFKKLFNLIEDKNIINLMECFDDFSWKELYACTL